TPKPSSSIKGSWKYNIHGWKNSNILRVLMFLFLIVFLYFSLAGNLLTETYDIEPGMVSVADIRAKDRILNEAATERAREKAAAEVEPVYTYVSLDNNSLISSIFDKLEWINPDNTYTRDEKIEIYRDFFPTEYAWHIDKLLKQYAREGYSASLLEEMREQ